jgi:NAD-dependent dihydropyrimidine dehydrogenase PreA subunit
MAANWFPTIDEEKCVACLQCVQFCPHGVYEEREGRPIVVNPDACVEFCRGCQKICDAGAISFPGDAQ